MIENVDNAVTYHETLFAEFYTGVFHINYPIPDNMKARLQSWRRKSLCIDMVLLLQINAAQGKWFIRKQSLLSSPM